MFILVERGAQSYSLRKSFNLKILEKSLAKRKTLEKSLAKRVILEKSLAKRVILEKSLAGFGSSPMFCQRVA